MALAPPLIREQRVPVLDCEDVILPGCHQVMPAVDWVPHIRERVLLVRISHDAGVAVGWSDEVVPQAKRVAHLVHDNATELIQHLGLSASSSGARQPLVLW